MNLNTNSWKEFNLSRTKEQPGLFIIENCKCSCADDLENGFDINYIGAKKNDNGVIRSVKIVPELVTKGNGILFICDGQGSVGYTNYMLEDFIGSTTTAIGYDSELNELRGMFLVSILDKERFKYSFGRKYKRNLPKAKISLPIQRNEDGTPKLDSSKKYSSEGYVPDWTFMSNYIKSLPYGDRLFVETSRTEQNRTEQNRTEQNRTEQNRTEQNRTEQNRTEQNRFYLAVIPHLENGYFWLEIKYELRQEVWQEFGLKDLFNIKLSKGDLKLNEVESGLIPLVSSGDTNNGIVGYIDENGDGKAEIFNGNVLTLDMFGKCYYQSENFYAVSHGRVNVLEPKFKLNVYNGLFLANIINKERYRFSYGRAVYSSVAEGIKIQLPILVNEFGKPIIDKDCTYSNKGYIPNFEFMEMYISSLPYGDRI